MAKRQLPVHKNEQRDITITDLTYEGMGVAKVDGYPLFIANALPGETARIHVMKVGKKFGFAKVIERYQDSEDRVPLRDEDGLRTGTMALQHMTYDAQLSFKQKTVQDSLEKFVSLQDVDVKPTLGMSDPWAYRNKAQVPIGQDDQGRLFTGFFRKNSHSLVPITNYQIQLPKIDEMLQTVIQILNEYNLTAYDEQTHQGLIRHLVIRQGYHTDDIMIILVINGDELPHQAAITEAIVAQIPNLASLIVNHNTRRTNVILGQEETLLYGEPYYRDQMLGLDFMISAKSFFQVNTPQAEVLYQQALEVGDIQADDVVIDAYCGIGSISLCLAQRAKHVYGVEVVSDAIEMAQANAKMNNLGNVTFVAGKAEDVIQEWQAAGIETNVVVVDPPRKGLASTFTDTVIELAPEKIVYVSCNPATLARDMNRLVAAGYHAETVQPVDLFPQTPHVECVTLLMKNR